MTVGDVYVVLRSHYEVENDCLMEKGLLCTVVGPFKEGYIGRVVYEDGTILNVKHSGIIKKFFKKMVDDKDN